MVLAVQAAQADGGVTEDPREFPNDTEGQTEDSQGGGLTSLLGAVISLTLLIGLGVWGYKLAVRDVSGIPVVRAVDGPMRVQPDDPGGESAAYQGFSVNAVQAEGGAEAPADTLALAPPIVGLTPEDAPAMARSEVSALSTPAPARPVPAESTDPSDAADQILALADQLTEDVAPLSEAVTDIVPTSSNNASATLEAANSAVAAALLQPQVISTSVPGLVRSPHPNYRPDDLAQLAAASAALAAEAGSIAAPEPADAGFPSVREVAATDIPVGTRLVQLGAFDSPEVARAEWNRLMVRFEDYLSGKERVIEQATSGGKTFFRLRALGFDDLSDARRFCAALMTGQAACIPVMTR
ncbi:MAG: SPOR domain-containing protein [Rhodobacteraceae bacterium]|nr:SPOR domain-containing protein [Paracoccaceae bacterium]